MRGGGGRKKLKQGALRSVNPLEELEASESIVRVVSLRGSNLIEVKGADGESTLCLLPAKFNKSIWIKRGSFVVVNVGERAKALESGSKVTGIISRVLFEEQIRAIKKTSMWPPAFKDEVVQSSTMEAQNDHEVNGTKAAEDEEKDGNFSDDDGLLPIEANQNRQSTNLWNALLSSSSSSSSSSSCLDDEEDGAGSEGEI